jgi:hypothetical protein
MQQVHTKLHRLQGEGFAKNLTLQAHYVVQDDVINAVYENGHRLARAAAEMQQAGRLTLPFDSVLVEADLGWRAPTSRLPARTMRMLVWLRRAPPPAAAVARIYGFAHMNGQDVAFEHKHEVPTSGALEDLRGIEQDDDAMPRSIAANAFLFAALMANTRGIEKVPVEHCGLNRKRAASGKPPVPAYTTVRIGTVYNKTTGEAVTHGRHMPVHWRAGHWRAQPCGTRRSQLKHIYIEPVLVNGDDGTQPLVRPKHVRV